VQDGKKLTRQTKTVSHRAYQTRLDDFRAKRPLSREAATKERSVGRLAYRTSQAKEATEFKKFAKYVRSEVDGITLPDLRLIRKKETEGWNDLDDDEREQFGMLFKRYSRSQILAALGSPPTK
jgi:hypothetical protein